MSSVSSIQTQAMGRATDPERVGAYAIYGEIGCGGMASVHLGKLLSASGFTRLVAVKRMHAELARSPEFVAMFMQEALLVGRIQHPNVVAALDCVAVNGSAMLVMEYVHGVSLHQLMRTPRPVPLPIASAIVVGAALGLHAAHEAVDENGKTLQIVHRDVSPQNVLVGVDGLARVLDFGIAKAAECVQYTRTGEVRGKVGYMAPEQLLGHRIGREADVYSLGVIMWELVTGRRLFVGEGQGQMMMRIANGRIDSPRSVHSRVTRQVDSVIRKALSRSPDARFRTAMEFAAAVEAVLPPSSQRVVGEWIEAAGSEELSRRSEIRGKIGRSASVWPRLEQAGRATTAAIGATQKEAAAIGSVSVVRVGPRVPAMASRRSAAAVPLVALAIALAASAAVGAARWLAAAGRPAVVAASRATAPPPAIARPLPARGDWTVATLPAPPPVAAVPMATEAPPVEALVADPFARRVSNPGNARRAPKAKVAGPGSSAAAAAGTTVRPESELTAIGGRE